MRGKANVPDPSEFKIGGVRIIATVWKQVEDVETAFKEANAARLALAKYKQIKQAFDSDDLGVVAHLLDSVKDDDDSAGAALLRIALLELREKKQRGPFYAVNEEKVRKHSADVEKWRRIADDLGLDWQGSPYAAAKAVAEKVSKNGEPSEKTLARAFDAK